MFLLNRKAWLLGAALSACGGTASTPSDGTGSFTVMSNGAIANEAPSYTRTVALSALPGCARVTVGACQINPCNGASVEDSSPIPDVGQVDISGADMTSLALQPAGGGTYAPLQVGGELAWSTGGQSVTFVWSHAPGDTSVDGGQVSVATPPYVTLLDGSTLSAPGNTIARSRDLTLAWTTASLPTALDFVLVDLTGPAVMGISTSFWCKFDASAGQALIPAAVLQQLGEGTGSYDVHAQESLSETVQTSGGSWQLDFNVDAHALTSTGTATGWVTFE